MKHTDWAATPKVEDAPLRNVSGADIFIRRIVGTGKDGKRYCYDVQLTGLTTPEEERDKVSQALRHVIESGPGVCRVLE